MSPGEPVCPGNRISFTCQKSGLPVLDWTITLSSGVKLSATVRFSQQGSIVTFVGDPGFNFEIHIVSSDTTELHVTAKRELNGVTVECTGSTGSFMYIIQVIGEFIMIPM